MTNDEKKAREIEFQEIRVAAREKIAQFKKEKRTVVYITGLSSALLLIACGYLAKIYYDAQMPLLSLAFLAVFAVLSCTVNIIAGGIVFHGASEYIKKRILCRRWNSAAAEMERIEEKAVEQTAYEGDITRAEEKLLKVSKTVIDEM